MRTVLFFTIFFSLVVCGPVAAQPSPYGSVDGNLGTWTWDKPQPPKSEDGEEREPGETSWERLNAERKAEAEQPAKEAAPKILSPLQLWRLWRGKPDEHRVEQNEEPSDAQSQEPNDAQNEE